MNAPVITYGSVANTRHSAKHCRGTVRKSRNAIVAGTKRLNKGITGSEYRIREALTLGEIHRANAPDPRDYHVEEGVVVRDEIKRKKPARERQHESEVHNEVRMFKPLPERSVNCSARGGHNGGTKDKSVSCTVSASPDVDNVSSMTGVISLARDGHHRTKVSDKVLAKEREKFRLCMKRRRVQQGRDEWTPEERTNEKLRKSALRNSARA